MEDAQFWQKSTYFNTVTIFKISKVKNIFIINQCDLTVNLSFIINYLMCFYYLKKFKNFI